MNGWVVGGVAGAAAVALGAGGYFWWVDREEQREALEKARREAEEQRRTAEEQRRRAEEAARMAAKPGTTTAPRPVSTPKPPDIGGFLAGAANAVQGIASVANGVNSALAGFGIRLW